MECDILALQNGLSCKKISHIRNFKTIFVRFIYKSTLHGNTRISESETHHPIESVSTLELSRKSGQLKSSVLPNVFNRPVVIKSHSPSYAVKPPQIYPHSISISSMLRIGSPI